MSQCCWYIIDHQLSSEGVPQPHPKRLPRQRAQSCRLEKINSGLQSELWMICWNKWNFSWRLLNGRCKMIKIQTGEMMWYFLAWPRIFDEARCFADCEFCEIVYHFYPLYHTWGDYKMLFIGQFGDISFSIQFIFSSGYNSRQNLTKYYQRSR